MIKHILVPTDGSSMATLAIHYAVAWARHYEATLHGIHVVDVQLLEGPFLQDISASLGTAPYINYQGNIAMLLEERGRTALEAFEKACAEANIPCDVTLTTGLVARSIVEKSPLMDLIVLGRGGEHNQWLDGLLGSTTEAVVRRTDRPVLVTGRDTPGAGRFVAAYDGSQHARNALHVAALTSASWNAPLSVVIVGEGHAQPLADEAQAYLDAHAIDVEYAIRSGDPGEAIVAFAQERAADLLMMGAFGHNKVRELVVGSITAYVLNRAPCPVLLTR